MSDAADLDATVMRSLERVRTFIDARLDAAIEMSPEASPRLCDAMRYALLAPGKRLRPALVLWAAGLTDSVAAGLSLAQQAIANGAGWQALERLRAALPAPVAG